MKPGTRHQPSGVGIHFHTADSFSEYVSETRALLCTVHAAREDAEQVIAGNAPFELFPVQGGRCRRGVLLTHGLSDSPYHMRHLGAFFARNGFRVMALLLPGHGTRPGDLLHVHWHEWAKAVAWGTEQLAREVEEVYLAGFSAGAALSVRQAACDRRVRGLFLYSPAFRIAARARWASLHRLYSWLIPEAAWLSVMKDRDPYKYESFCKNAVTQMYALTRALPTRLPAIPVFAAASADDATVESSATWHLMQTAPHPHNHLVWYATKPAEGRNVEWIRSDLPERRILSGAHTAVVIPPWDGHYGERGTYVNCLHYFRDEAAYRRCLTLTHPWYGEVMAPYLAQGPLRRLTYNPHYAAMETSMQRFIEGLP